MSHVTLFYFLPQFPLLTLINEDRSWICICNESTTIMKSFFEVISLCLTILIILI